MLQALNLNRKKPWTIRSITRADCCYWVIGIQVMTEICQRVLDGFGMSVEWALSMVVPMFKCKGDKRNCRCY